jgi:CheY-like chemotaxis protein
MISEGRKIVRPVVSLQRRLLILCVEDNKTHLRLRKAVLERNGYFVASAANAAEAMRLFRENPVCLVLTDHFLRGITGTQLAAQMKKLKPEVPIVLYSGHAPESMNNADCFIHKGDSVEHFLSMISNLVQRSAA